MHHNKIQQGIGIIPPARSDSIKTNPLKQTTEGGNGQSEVTKPNWADSGYPGTEIFGTPPQTT